MKVPAALIVTVLICIILFTGCISPPAAVVPGTPVPVTSEGKTRYVIGVDGDYAPFTWKDAGGNFTGLDIEAARWIAERKGFEPVFVAVPWEGIIPALNEGRIDMIYSGMTITPDRQSQVDFTDPYYTVNLSIAARSGSFGTMNDLYSGRLTIGAQMGTPGAAWVEKHLVNTGVMPASQLLLYPDVPNLTAYLMSGTIDASIADSPAQAWAVKGKPLEIAGTIPTGGTYAIAVRKTDPALRSTMNDGLRQLKADPAWAQMLRKYGLDQ